MTRFKRNSILACILLCFGVFFLSLAGFRELICMQKCRASAFLHNRILLNSWLLQQTSLAIVQSLITIIKSISLFIRCCRSEPNKGSLSCFQLPSCSSIDTEKMHLDLSFVPKDVPIKIMSTKLQNHN
jgi:hypothetical protein